MEFVIYIESELPTNTQSTADDALKWLEDWLTHLNKLLSVQSCTEIFPCSDPETGVKVLNVRMKLHRTIKHSYNYVHLVNVYYEMVCLLNNLNTPYYYTMSIEESF